MATIGFFGDSFCMFYQNDHSIEHNYDTYIKQVADHNNQSMTDILNYGHGGSSYWDTILVQFKPFIDNPPDICIFVWTEPHRRIFHRKCRTLWEARIKDNKLLAIWKLFQKNFFDKEKSDMEYISALHYFDTEVLSKLKNIKIIHLWGFGSFDNYSINSNEYNNSLSYPYKFKTGVEIRPALLSFSYTRDIKEKLYDYMYIPHPNHIAGKEANDKVSNLIIDAIENYK